MPCCCRDTTGIGRFFSHFARRYRKRYQRRGLEKSQQNLVRGLGKAGIEGATLLEIGCGVGYLHQELLKAGAASAAGIDISEAMLAEARALAAEQGLSARARYIAGDFVQLAEGIAGADVAILDKVVCCYPDADALLTLSLAKTGSVYALTYPRAHFLNRAGAAVLALLLKMIRSRFRSYVHDPKRIEAVIEMNGFRKQFEDRTPIWLTQVYVRR